MDGQPIIPSHPMNPFCLTASTFIAGGGPVGLILALGLARLGGRVTVAEQFDLQHKSTATSFDGRVLALTYGTKLILERLGIWAHLRAYTTRIESVHVSQKGYLGFTQLTADEMQVPALGYSITGQDLGKVLTQLVLENELIDLMSPAKLTGLEMLPTSVRVSVEKLKGNEDKDNEEEEIALEVDLVVGADGTDSTVRKQLGLSIEVKDYEAFGIIAKIETECPPNHQAFERFTEEGPVALLPMGGYASKAVLVCPKEQLNEIMQLDDAAYMAYFAEKMGERLGRFTQVSERRVYPLKETYAPKMCQDRAVLMGNASHTQHPVAAQGLNLGIADIEAFLTLIERQSQQDIGDPDFLRAYAQQRQEHHQKIMGLTDGLIHLFQNKSPVIGHLRGLGLMAMQTLPSLKKRFTRVSMGVSK